MDESVVVSMEKMGLSASDHIMVIRPSVALLAQSPVITGRRERSF